MDGTVSLDSGIVTETNVRYLIVKLMTGRQGVWRSTTGCMYRGAEDEETEEVERRQQRGRIEEVFVRNAESRHKLTGPAIRTRPHQET